MTDHSITGPITRNGNRITLSGDLTVKTVRQLFDQTPSFGTEEVTVALDTVREADSAGFALLVHWSNLACAASVPLAFTGAPARLRQLAKITDLATLFSD